jgi:hypothetical protein
MLRGQSIPPYDGEPDFESCLGIPTSRSRLIALVTHSGKLIGEECEPELDTEVEMSVGPDTDPWRLLQSQAQVTGLPGAENGVTGSPGGENGVTG